MNETKRTIGQIVVVGIMLGIFAAAIALFLGGCAYSENIKALPVLTEQALDAAEAAYIDQVGENASRTVLKPIADGKSFQVPIKTVFGEPSEKPAYDSEVDYTDFVSQAQRDAEERAFWTGLFNTFEKRMVALALNIFPKLPLGVTWEQVMCAILGVLGLRYGAPPAYKGAKKVVKKIRKNGNGKGADNGKGNT